jgi:hypothetical protein
MSADFQQRLCDFAVAQLGKQYARPDTVCMALALQGIDYACGTMFYADHRQHFKSAASMKAFVGGAGLDGLIAVMSEQGFVEIDPVQMTVGDIGFSGQGVLGIGAALQIGRNALTSHPDTGVAIYPVAQLELVRAVRFNRHGVR